MSIDIELRKYATPRQAEYFDAVVKYGTHGKASRAMGVPRTDISKALRRLKVSAKKRGYIEPEVVPTIDPETYTPPKKEPEPTVEMRSKAEKSSIYIITSAQNATPIHKGFWESILFYAKKRGAEIIVLPSRYKNATSQWTQQQESHEWWDKNVTKYLFNGRHNIAGNVTVLGDVIVQPTAARPLSGLDTITQHMSGIVGHPKIELRCIATPQNKLPKIMITTGSCTIPNYTDSKAGKKGEFHHSLGAVVVENMGKRFYMRHINAVSDGSFCDLDMEYTPRGIVKAPRPLGITLGDSHVQFIDKTVDMVTNEIIATLRPRHIFWHDVMDFYSRNHHHKGNWIVGYGKWKYGIDSVRVEFEESIKHIVDRTPKDTKSVVVGSNHPDAMQRWLKEVDWRQDPPNAEFYLECALNLVKSVKLGDGGVSYNDPFSDMGKKIAPHVTFLERDDSFILGDVEHAFHGDQGVNGTRGSTMALSKVGVKVTKAHNHTPEVIDGCHSVGKSTGKLEYESGASSHLNSHVLQYYNGKRTHIHIINGKWRI